jgi:endonuclease G
VPQSPKGEISRPGDSGSWHLNEDTHEVAALHFAGSNMPETALAIDMPRVFSTLDVALPLIEQDFPHEPVPTAVSRTFDPKMLVGVR